MNSQSKLAEAVMLLVFIQEITGSNLDRHTENDERIFVGFLCPSSQIPG